MNESDRHASQQTVLIALTVMAFTLLVVWFAVRRPRPRPMQPSTVTAGVSEIPTASSDGPATGPVGSPAGSWREDHPWLARQARIEAQLSDEDWLRQDAAMEHEGLRGDHS